MQKDLPMQATSELTEREREILRLIASGASNKDIALQLFISPNTVKVHLRNIFAKIGAASRTEAAVYAIREGIAQAADLPALAHATQESPAVIPAPLETKNKTYYFWIAALITVLLAGVVALMVRTTRAPTIAVASPEPAATPLPRWQARADLPTARGGLAVAVYENQIYAIGGETTQGVTGMMEQYDVASDTWKALTPKPLPVTDINAAVIGGQIYIPGGRLASGRVTDVLESYDPRRAQWERHAPLPAALSGYALVAFEGKLYIFGGWDGQKFLATVYEYDPGQDNWIERTPMPTARGFAGAAIAGGKIYVIGGTAGEQALGINEAYTPNREGVDNPWESFEPMPSSRAHPGVGSVADVVYILGSAVPEETFSFIAYLSQTDEWQAFETPPVSAKNKIALISLGEYLYAIGGTLEGDQAGVMLAYRAVYTVGIPVIIK